jgi:non-heme chloroperoxidase
VKQTPVVLINGPWFHMSSWERWAERFTSRGFVVCVPGWPGEAATVAQTRRDPGPLRDLGLSVLTAHYERIVRSFSRPPILIGHSTGGLIAQRLIGAGLGQAAVALAPLPVDGVWPVEAGTRMWPPITAGSGAHQGFVSLSRPQFRHTVANAVGEEEAAELFERYAVPAPLRLLTDLGLDGGVGLERGADSGADSADDDGEAIGSIDTGNVTRGPLLLVSGQEDRMVPDAVTRGAYKLYGDSTAVTDLKQYADRGHSFVVDSGWHSVADYVLSWLDANGVDAVAAQD